jgi:hypothetical protein
MHALVVYESMFGNTEEIAKAVAEGLLAHMSVDSIEVGNAAKEIGVDIDLLVVGGPTHAFGMSRPLTREDAAKQAGHDVVSSGIGIREWLEDLTNPSGQVQAAAFDTRVRKPRVPGSAAHAAEKRLRRLRFPIARRAENFWVEGTPGPLADGELDRARRWGENLGLELLQPKGTKRAS